MVMER